MLIKNKVTIKLVLVIILSSLFFVSILTPLTTVCNNVGISKDNMLVRNYNYEKYTLSKISNEGQQTYEKQAKGDNSVKSEKKYETGVTTQSSGGPADSPWPMICHDLRHTGRSPYSPDNSGIEKWRFRTDDCIEGSPVIGKDGTIYVGDLDRLVYAINPNGTLKWKYRTGGWIYLSAPAVTEDGTIYVSSWDGKLHAFYPNGTLKWKCGIGASSSSSPAIGVDGTIYLGTLSPGNSIVAVNQNGTKKWTYKTGYHVVSDPAIGEDGTIYIGSSDDYLYAMNPNGTLKWRYKTGDWIQGHPSIADDGTIYVPSFDDYLYALYPNGTFKWRAKIGPGGDTSASIAQDGTLYIGSNNLYAFYPNGTRKLSVNLGSNMFDSCPAISADGNIYICAGQSLVAVDSNGVELWRKKLGKLVSSPAIGKDRTIYVGSGQDGFGYLHAFGPLDPDGPIAPVIKGKTNGKAGEEYEYTFKSTSPLGREIYYNIEWGDGSIKDWFGPYSSGEMVKVTHTYSDQGTFTIQARAKDTENLWSPWGTLEVTMPRNKETSYSFFYQFLERFPLLKQLFSFQFKFN